MRYVFSLFVTLLLACGSVLANGPLLQKLQQIKEISGIRELKVQPYTEYYEFWYEQPIDHNNPSKGTFKQRVLLGHRDFNTPMVAILEGYGIYSPAESELSKLFKTNQLTIEHRFFNNSKPEGETPWTDLTLKQAAARDYSSLTTKNISEHEMDLHGNQQRGTDNRLSPLFLPGRRGDKRALRGSH